MGQAAGHCKHDLHVVRQAKLPSNRALELKHAVDSGARCYDVRAAVDLDGHRDALYELIIVRCERG